ncbi:hypothetical protein PsYK624_122300 [Phanerochaete sordida]|uniref:F-box domain-containing protein n=1 Tax=Phanerochaete sordida TaxID=48140 RepID=A0A9P3GI60_9APHY|nr:hypothetical protein PsYK624_122300 [Phanerochaete sordida]
MGKIPVELQDYVLDSLRGSRTALVNCALVCRAWRRRARFNLFHTIHIDWTERRRTDVFFEALLKTHDLVHDLTLTSAGGMQPGELVKLLDTLENLESLSIFAHRRTHGILSLMLFTTADFEHGEQLLLAIARKERLRALDFTPRGLLYNWRHGAHVHAGRALAVYGLRELRSLDGDIFPASRMHRFWTALAAAKAEAGAAPLDHFGTTVRDLQPLARFMRDVGAQLRSLRLDIRETFLSGENTVSSFRESGIVLSQCTNLRTLVLCLEAPSTRDNGNIDVCTTLLSTATEGVPLAHVQITLHHLSGSFFMLAHIQERLAALDESIVGLAHLKRIDWHLADCVPDSNATSLGDEDTLPVLFGEHFSQLAAQKERIEVNWTSDVDPTRHPRAGGV